MHLNQTSRWVVLYFLNVIIATLGVFLAVGFLLNVVLHPVALMAGRGSVLWLAAAPYYPLPIVLGFVWGYWSRLKFGGTYRYWVWIVPAFYLLVILGRAMAGGENWTTHFFGSGCLPDCRDQDSSTLPFYTAVAYSFGALIERIKHASNSSQLG